MATLIQSKQIEGVVTASVIQGDFTVQAGSVDLTTASGVSGSFSGSFVGDGSGLTNIPYSSITGTPIFKGGTNVTIASSSNVITISSTGGGGGGSTDISYLNSFTSSYYVDSASFDSRISSIVLSGVPSGTISGSSQVNFTQISNVPSGLVSSSSQITDGSGIVSGSVLRTLGGTGVLSASVDFNTYSASVATAIDNIVHTQIPAGTISGSSQVTLSDVDGFTAYSASVQTTIDSIQHTQIPSGVISGSTFTTFSSSVDSRLDVVESLAGVLDTSATPFTYLASGSSYDFGLYYPVKLDYKVGDIIYVESVDKQARGIAGTVVSYNSSTRVLRLNIYDTIGDTGYVQGRHPWVLTKYVSGFVNNTTFTSLSSSVDSRLTTLENQTDNTGSDSQTLSIAGDQLTISGGNTVTIPTGSGSGTSDFTQLTNVPSGLVSGSSQVDFTQISNVPSGLVSGSSQVDFTQLTNVPSGLVSSSTQITDGSGIVSGSVLRTLGGTNVLSGSILPGTNVTIDSSSGDYVISATGGGSVPSGTISSSQQISDLGYITSSTEAPFNGNRIVSNTLLGDLYTSGYNAGTSGSLAQFINEVFFPSAAPTATFTTQSAYYNTNLATNGTNLVSVSITDTVDDSPYTLTLSGTNASSLTAVPTNADSSSWEIRANGDLNAGTYSYNVVVGDKNSATRTYSGRSIVIAQADNGTLSTNGTLYIIESATSGVITLSSTGRPGSTGAVSVSYSPNYGSQVATNFSSSNPLISVNSTNGQLSVGSPISGSGNLSGDTITSTISWEDQYGNTDSANISVNVTTNYAPTRSATLTTNNNTNQATGSAQIIRLTITDTEGDSIPNSGLTFTSYNSTYFTPTISSPYMYLNVNNTSVPAGTYSYTATFEDIHGFRTTTYNSSITINQAGVGTLGGDKTSYIIESALSGSVLRDVTGFNAGNPSQLTVSYSPNYGSQVVQSYTSSNSDIVVSNTGHLTLAVDLSGSATQSGDTISTNITYQDQYGNVGSGSVTVNVFANNAPAITFVSSSNYDTDTAISGSTAGTITVTDTESNTPFVLSLGGTDGGKFDIQGTSSPYTIEPTGSLSQGTYTISITATDDYGKTTTVTNKNIIVDSAATYGKAYVYDLGQYNSNVLYDLGVSSVNSSTPPVVTTYSGNGFLEKIEDGSLGNSSISYTWGTAKTATLLASGSGANLNTLVQSFGNISKANSNRFAIIVPADLDMSGIPTSMANSYGGSTSGEYVLEVAVDGGAFGAGLGTIEDSTVYGVTLGSAVEGTTNYRVIVENNQVASATSIKLAVVPSSGSTPS